MKARDFRVYIPNEIRKPLIWFIIASIVGIVWQSIKNHHLVFVNFFWKNYTNSINILGQSLQAGLFLGFKIVFIVLLEIFYYVIMTVCFLIIIYHLILTLNKKNTQKIFVYLVIIIGLVILFSYVQQHSSISASKNTCPEGIIPDKLLITENKIPTLTLSLTSGNTFTQAGSVTPSWNDGSPIEYDFFNPPCHQGSSEGENINYFYCSFDYSKSVTNVSNEGTIGKTTNTYYKINLIMGRDNSNDAVVFNNPVASLVYYKINSATCFKQ
ncbi:MAG: hypothetical protein AABW63_01265 [Nanoarchaeota archaeon]